MEKRSPLPIDPNENVTGLAASVIEMRRSLASADPARLAASTGFTYEANGPDSGLFSTPLFGSPVTIPFPELVAYRADGAALALPVQALLFFHMSVSDGMPATGNWVTFRDLPGGRVYAQAFQGYSGDKLVRQFGDRLEAFQNACRAAGGERIQMGDAAYVFHALPRLPLAVTYWLGEDEFPSNAKVLFDSSAANHLPIDVCAILGSMLVSRISKAAA